MISDIDRELFHLRYKADSKILKTLNSEEYVKQMT